MEDQNGHLLKYPTKVFDMGLMWLLELIQSHILQYVLEKKV